MAQWHGKSDKKTSGGLRKSNRARDKLLSEKGRDFEAIKVATAEEKERRVKVFGRGSSVKVSERIVKFANVLGKGKTPIVSVVENNANRQYARRNIMTKGAIINVTVDKKETKAIVTNRPGQQGTVNAQLIEEAA